MAKNKERYGVVDIGSNTMRFNVYNIYGDKFKVISSKKTFAGLSSYVEDNLMTQAGIDKISKVLKKFNSLGEELNVEKMYIFATAAIRNISNSAEVLDEVRDKTGLNLTLLSGRMEGFCDFLGVKLENNIEHGYILDIGGGSTELIYVSDGEYVDSISIDDGSLSIYKKFVSGILPTEEEYRNIEKYVLQKITSQGYPKIEGELLYGVGGTIRATGNISQEYFHLSTNKFVTLEQVDELINLMIKNDSKLIHTILQVTPERIHTQVCGMIVLKNMMKLLGINDISICKNGVREGYLYLKQKEIDHAK